MSIGALFAEYVGELPIKIGNFELTEKFVEENSSLDLEQIDDDYWRYFKEIIDDTNRICSTGGDIYRYIFVDDVDDIDKENLGIHWTSDESGLDVEAYESEIVAGLVHENPELENKALVVFVIASVPTGCVDIEETMRKMLENPHEREIVIKQNCLSKMTIKETYPEDNPYNEESFNDEDDDE